MMWLLHSIKHNLDMLGQIMILKIPEMELQDLFETQLMKKDQWEEAKLSQLTLGKVLSLKKQIPQNLKSWKFKILMLIQVMNSLMTLLQILGMVEIELKQGLSKNHLMKKKVKKVKRGKKKIIK